jgi:hypothetical protein
MHSEKEGRPPASIAAWRSLHARHEMGLRYPAVAALVDMLALGDVDLATVTGAVEIARTQLLQGSYRQRSAQLPNAMLDERRLHTAAEVERLSQDRRALADVRTAIDAELATVESLLADAQDRMLRQSLEREPIDDYLYRVRPKLAAAGLTASIARSMGPDQIKAIQDVLAAGTADKRAPARPVTRRRAEEALEWRADNPWADFLRGVEGYDFNPQPGGSGGVDIGFLRLCGLPPYLNLAEFGYPFLMGAVESAKEPAALEAACLAVFRRWISDNITSGFQEHVEAMRERAWALLFGLRYDYAKKLDRYSRVNLPSPWKKDQQIIAIRRN